MTLTYTTYRGFTVERRSYSEYYVVHLKAVYPSLAEAHAGIDRMIKARTR